MANGQAGTHIIKYLRLGVLVGTQATISDIANDTFAMGNDGRCCDSSPNPHLSKVESE